MRKLLNLTNTYKQILKEADKFGNDLDSSNKKGWVALVYFVKQGKKRFYLQSEDLKLAEEELFRKTGPLKIIGLFIVKKENETALDDVEQSVQ